MTENSETEETTPTRSPIMDASFSTLVMSLGSSALMSLGVISDPSGQTTENRDVAKFNIDLLVMLKEKTKNNLSKEEQQTLDSIVSDLQLKYVQTEKK